MKRVKSDCIVHKFHICQRCYKDILNLLFQKINMVEIWKNIKGYENLYQVSSMGNVRRVSYTHKLTVNKKPKILKQSPKGNYTLVSLCDKQGQSKTYLQFNISRG